MKKTYLKPGITLDELRAETPIMAASGISSVTLSDEEQIESEDDILAKFKFSIWGDDDEE